MSDANYQNQDPTATDAEVGAAASAAAHAAVGLPAASDTSATADASDGAAAGVTNEKSEE